MFCGKCGNKLENNSNFCPYCNNQTTNLPNNINYNKKTTNNSTKIIVVIFMTIIIFLLGIASFLVINQKGTLINKKINSRTIMIYMAGNNLESDQSIATYDIKSIDPNKINLENTNVLLYTGSTKKWHNFVSSDENAIYILKSTGFEKLESYDATSMGESDVFKSFLDYSYKNYKADLYDLIIWDHGLGGLGSISDENSNDFLTVVEMKEALENSSFNSKNKINTVLFRTCLNATAEVAYAFSDYANYMIASQEVTIGSKGESVLNFINNVSLNDDAYNYGKKYIESYKEQVSNVDVFNSIDTTYSIINLKMMNNLKDDLNNFFSDINIKENYNSIARVRSNMHQYAVEAASEENYDTIDLYDLVDNLKNYSPTKAKKLINNLKSMIEFNYSTNNFSNGLSIYFPFNGEDAVKDIHFKLYSELDFSSSYYDFIKKFHNIQSSSEDIYNFSLSSNKVNLKDREFSLKLNDEQAKNFASASYYIFKKEDNGYFTPIYVSKNTTFDDKKNIIKTNISNNLIKVYDKKDKDEQYFTVVETDYKNKEYSSSVTLFKNSEELKDIKNDAASIRIKIDKKNKPYITTTLLLDKTQPSSRIVDVKDYTSIDFPIFQYNILDENGNYKEDWEKNNTLYMYEVKVKNYELKRATLDNSNDYYCVFKIKDVKNNQYYSNLIKIEE